MPCGQTGRAPIGGFEAAGGRRQAGHIRHDMAYGPTRVEKGGEPFDIWHEEAEHTMYTRLTVMTILIALFGLGMSYVAQRAAPATSNSFVASVSGGTCDYSSGTLCRINRAGTGMQAKF
tara:strand:- start:68 stop:424 length:357 start_codon:yes stop_codon:yes gene_type:complete